MTNQKRLMFILSRFSNKLYGFSVWMEDFSYVVNSGLLWKLSEFCAKISNKISHIASGL